MRTDRRTFVRLGVGGTMGGLLSLVLAQDSGKRGIKIGCGLNPRFTKRFVRTVKESCLDRMILFGEESLRTTMHNFVAHYHTERNHQGLAIDRPIFPHFSAVMIRSSWDAAARSRWSSRCSRRRVFSSTI